MPGVFDLFPSHLHPHPNADESAGVPAVAREKARENDSQLVARRKELVAAYLAVSRYADDCVGRILAGLEKGPYRDNTIVVIFGDNGYQFGEKNIWNKGRLWEGSTHVPLVMVGPGIARIKHRSTDRLLDLYPTLLELAALPRAGS